MVQHITSFHQQLHHFIEMSDRISILISVRRKNLHLVEVKICVVLRFLMAKCMCAFFNLFSNNRTCVKNFEKSCCGLRHRMKIFYYFNISWGENSINSVFTEKLVNTFVPILIVSKWSFAKISCYNVAFRAGNWSY